MAELESGNLRYGITDVPPLATLVFFSLQQVIVCASGIVSNPLIVTNLLCASENAMARVKLIGTSLFVTGFSTMAQTTFGSRLPMMQGPSFAFMTPIIAMMKLPEFQCPDFHNFSNSSDFDVREYMDDVWRNRMQIVQGALISSATFEMIIGLTGVVGFITKFVGPLTIAPLMVCLEISVAQVALRYASQHWISILTILLLLVTALFLHEVKVPFPVYDKVKKCSIGKFAPFAVFPYLIAIGFVWTLCALLTQTDVFDMVYNRAARTDLRSYVIEEAPWFTWPYPGQWGPINFNVGIFLGMIAATLSSVIESIGDYHACARACGQPPPPSHSVNRGIAMEGLCCIFGGLIGSGVSVTTYSENIGVIGITKVASRRMMQLAGLVFILLGVFTKFGAILATIPDPIVGGLLTVSCAMVGGVGLSSVQMIDLKLSRNIAVLGLAIIFGIMIPSYVETYPIDTGILQLDQLLNILLGINMFVGGISGFILDNTVPGALRQQRGLNAHNVVKKQTAETVDIYAFNSIVMKILGKIPLANYMPFLPKTKTRIVMPINVHPVVTKL